MSHSDIAIALGISRPTLLKHFAHELKQGAVAKRLEVLESMHRAAKKGSVSAQREYLKTTLAMEPEQTPQVAPKPKPGKKEQAQEEAQTAAQGTDWDDLLPPHNAIIQ